MQKQRQSYILWGMGVGIALLAVGVGGLSYWRSRSLSLLPNQPLGEWQNRQISNSTEALASEQIAQLEALVRDGKGLDQQRARFVLAVERDWSKPIHSLLRTS
jgi:hypothetical protein